jgi:hypothetical protein
VGAGAIAKYEDSGLDDAVDADMIIKPSPEFKNFKLK